MSSCSRHAQIAFLSILSIAARSYPQDCPPHEIQKLTASDAAAGDFFGVSVSVDGRWMIVGARFDSDAGFRSGSAYIFRRDENATPADSSDDFWIEHAKITASDAQTDDRFGVSVGLSGDYAVVGARFDDDDGDRSGSAYVFRRNDMGTTGDLTDDSWLEVSKLTASDAQADDNFGTSVSISGDRALVGSFFDVHLGVATGSAYVFQRSDNGTRLDLTDDLWTEVAKLVASDGADADRFGKFVSISGTRALIGTKFSDASGVDSGAAYIYRCDDSGTPMDPSDDQWFEEQKIVGHDSGPGDEFGVSVNINGELAIVGAFDDSPAGTLSGAAYIFRLHDNATPADPADDFWQEETKLTALDVNEGDVFGVGVAIAGDRASVGAFFDSDTLQEAGSAYVFHRNDAGTPSVAFDDYWEQEEKVTASDPAPLDHFGAVVALADNHLIVSSVSDDDDGDGSGSVYVFELQGGCNCNGIADQSDIANGTSSDSNANGIPDECENIIPAMSPIGLGLVFAGISLAGMVMLRRRSVESHQAAWPRSH